MDYMTLKEASEKWGVTTRWINYLCTAGRIPGAVKMGTVWLRAVSHFGCHQCLQPNWRGWSKHL